MDPQPDEFQERARRAFENQDMAQGYFASFRGAAMTALIVGLVGVALMCLAWLISGPELNHNTHPPPPQTVVVKPGR